MLLRRIGDSNTGGDRRVARIGVIGLLSDHGAPVPLLGVSVEAELRDFAVRQTITQRYRNLESGPIEAVYVFPLDEGAAVCGFNAVIGDRLVTGQVEERDKAFDRYDDALSQGHGAYLLDQERPDVFTASLGNVPPGVEVLIQVITVSLLALEGGDLTYVLPTTVSPRYAPLEDQIGVGRPPAEALNPPVAWKVPYGLEVDLRVEMPSTIRKIESPTHPISVETNGASARVTLGEGMAQLDRDLVLRIGLEGAPAARVHLERTASGSYAAMLVFLPDLHTPAEIVQKEVVFLVDRSGSMGGPSIESARSALRLFLRSLPEGSRFNLVGFGSTFQSLFSNSVPYGPESFDQADAHVDGIEADFGGTEILPALEHILSQPAVSGFARELIILTDGQVTNTEAVLELVRAHTADTRVFAIGVGAGASRHLVNGLARAGRGVAEFIAPGERLEAKVMRQVGRCLSPAVQDLRVDWGGLTVEQAPFLVPPAFAGERVIVFGLVSDLGPGRVTLTGRAGEKPFTEELALDPGQAGEGILTATLAARWLVRDLEEGTSRLHAPGGSRQVDRRPPVDVQVKARLIELGKTYSLLTSATSFVAVEERKDPVTGEIALRKVPVALTRGWGGVDEPVVAAMPAPSAAQHTTRSVLFSMLSVSEEDHRDLRPSVEPSEPRPDARSTSLVTVLALQQQQGCWELTQDLLDLAGIEGTPDDVSRRYGIAAQDREARRAVATWLALLWLEANGGRDRSTWRLAAAKARKWLDASTATDATGRGWEAIARELLA